MKKLVFVFVCVLSVTALLASDGGFAVSQVSAVQRWPWNRKVDIGFRMSQPSAYAATSWGAAVQVAVTYDGETHVLPREALSCDTIFGSGCQTITWTPGAELGNARIESAVFSVTVTNAPVHATYMVVDLDSGVRKYAGADFAEQVNSDIYKRSKMVFRYCPATTSDAWMSISGGNDYFTIGSPTTESGRRDGTSENQQNIRLTKGFWFAVFPTTWMQWTKLGGARSTQTSATYDCYPACGLTYDVVRGADTSTSGYRYPTSKDVDASTPLGRLRTLTGVAFDLPTEAQWEYACRAGTTSRYFWGSTFNSDYVSGECVVGTKKSNNWGIFDLIGGVHQWTTTLGRRTDAGGSANDRIDYTAGDDPEGETPTYDNPYRITRGTCSSAKADSNATRSAYRYPQKTSAPGEQARCGCRFALTEGADVETAASIVSGVVVSDVMIRSREPWEEKVDIDFTLGGIDAADAIKLALILSNGLERVSADESAFDTLFAHNGRNRIVWTPGRQHKGSHFERLTVSIVPAADANAVPEYMVVNLMDGSFIYYPESYSEQVNSNRNKSDHMAFRRCFATTSDKWKAISGGKDYYMIGSPTTEGGRRSGTSEDQKSVRLTKDFWLAVFPTTWVQWATLGGSRSTETSATYDFYPARGLTYDAIRGADTSTSGYHYPTSKDVDASTPLGRLRALTGVAFDLPTEAQWEYACRAGTTTKYFWGTAADSSRTYIMSDGSWGTNPVGSKLPNGWGIYDLIGGVHQWTTTLGWRSADTSTEANRIDHRGGDDPEGETPTYDNPYRVTRGSCCTGAGDSGATRSAYRYPQKTSDPAASDWCGCRFALTISEN